jgi:hypothetical protein
MEGHPIRLRHPGGGDFFRKLLKGGDLAPRLIAELAGAVLVEEVYAVAFGLVEVALDQKCGALLR